MEELDSCSTASHTSESLASSPSQTLSSIMSATSSPAASHPLVRLDGVTFSWSGERGQNTVSGVSFSLTHVSLCVHTFYSFYCLEHVCFTSGEASTGNSRPCGSWKGTYVVQTQPEHQTDTLKKMYPRLVCVCIGLKKKKCGKPELRLKLYTLCYEAGMDRKWPMYAQLCPEPLLVHEKYAVCVCA